MQSRHKLRGGLARAIRAFRAYRGLTQEDLESAITRRYVSLLETGRKSPTVDTLGSIAAAMDTRPSVLILAAELFAIPQTKRAALLEEISREAARLIETQR